jgi:dihydroorotate dehydrogenase (fumarate)
MTPSFETTYLGLKLRSPLVASASPLAQNIDNIKRLEDAGAGAVVLNSLYEEQIRQEREALHHHLEHGTESFAEALSYFPEPDVYHAGTDAYLEQIRLAKEAVDIPIMPSINGSSLGGWTRFANRMEQAGADALELNIYWIPTDPNMTGAQVEKNYIDIVKAVRAAVTIPVAVKLSPFFSSLANMARQFEAAGADALVMFNRFYQPDIDLEMLEVAPNVLLSTAQALRLPLRWVAILYGHLKLDLAASGGVHTGEDALKLLMAGATVTMMTSALLRHGIEHLSVVENEMRTWMVNHEYESVAQMRGSMSQRNSPNPAAFERAQYMKALKGYLPNP